ncbi:hypothetical protein K6W80_35520, partial [Burkholderia contaminans]|uniref:hypothetical protein n=1 Tax=Burkholderia contaminans TaxID=488447 RepID=UPI001C97898F
MANVDKTVQDRYQPAVNLGKVVARFRFECSVISTCQACNGMAIEIRCVNERGPHGATTPPGGRPPPKQQPTTGVYNGGAQNKHPAEFG